LIKAERAEAIRPIDFGGEVKLLGVVELRELLKRAADEG
jgi:hypothetical protein